MRIPLPVYATGSFPTRDHSRMVSGDSRNSRAASLTVRNVLTLNLLDNQELRGHRFLCLESLKDLCDDMFVNFE